MKSCSKSFYLYTYRYTILAYILHAVNVLEKIATTLGVKGLNLYEDPCKLKTLKIDQKIGDPEIKNTIFCDVCYNNTCHITNM